MVHEDMARDLESYGIPILYVGDHGQLPPVGAMGSKVSNPDLRLEKIHRQAEGSPIIALSQCVRTTGHLPSTVLGGSGKGVVYKARRDMNVVVKDLAYHASAQMRTSLIIGNEQTSTVGFAVITRTNSMRLLWNKLIRKARYGKDFDPMPLPGDYVIALRNRPPIFNGMRGIVQQILGRRPLVTDLLVKFDDLPTASRVTASNFQFNREGTFQNPAEIENAALAKGIDQETLDVPGIYWGELLDYGYALTCHKAQGSSFDTVVLYLDKILNPMDENNRRWLYTAVTRAKQDIIILT
jgi:exodeoxyribonuclease-5